MYAQYWNLERPPFENDWDPAFFFRSRAHHAALLKLKYLADSNKGAGLLCGETGAGKTYLTRLLLLELDGHFGPFIHLRYPFLTPSEFVAFVASELGADEGSMPVDGGFDQTLRQFESRLRSFSEKHRHPVIIIDDAHLIEDQQVFQAIHLLLNYRHEFPFTVLIAGQTSLLSRIERITELADRLETRSILHPFDREETAEYVEHRLRTAGLHKSAFNAAAINEIHELSGGIPRRINRIADLSLLVGFADGLSSLGVKEVESVADEIGLAVPAA